MFFVFLGFDQKVTNSTFLTFFVIVSTFSIDFRGQIEDLKMSWKKWIDLSTFNKFQWSFNPSIFQNISSLIWLLKNWKILTCSAWTPIWSQCLPHSLLEFVIKFGLFKLKFLPLNKWSWRIYFFKFWPWYHNNQFSRECRWWTAFKFSH